MIVIGWGQALSRRCFIPSSFSTGYRQKKISENVVNFDFQRGVDLFIREILGDWSQIMSKLDFSSEISTTSAGFDRKH